MLLGLPEGGVVNLGHPGSKPLFDYDVLREMLDKERMSPKIILVGAILTSWRQHELEKGATGEIPALRVALGLGDANLEVIAGSGTAALAALVDEERQSWAMMLRDMLTLQARRLDTHIKLALRGRSTWDVFISKPYIDTERSNICFRQGWKFEQKLDHKLQAKETYRTLFEGAAPTGELDPSDFLEHPQYLAEREGLRQIAQMASTRGITAYTLYLPGVYTPQLPAVFLDRFEAEIGMPVLTFPQEFREALGSRHYTDPTHMTVDGRAIISDWLAAQLKPLLAAR